MGAKGLALLIDAKPHKGASVDEEEGDEEADDEGETEEQYADLAFDALKDDDKEAFRKAFLGAIRTCSSSYEKKE